MTDQSMHAPTIAITKTNTWRYSTAIVQTLKPEPFTGKHGTSVEAWLLKAERYLSVLDITDEVAILLASAMLKDYAETWWIMHLSHIDSKIEPPVQTFSQFKTLLLETFCPADAKKNALEKITKLCQTKTVCEYTHEFLHLACEVNFNEEQLIFFYTNGLKAQISKDVDIQIPLTLRQAITIAERLDAHYGRTLTPGTSSTPTTSSGPAPMELDTIKSKDKDFKKDKKCHYCHKFGHFKAECRKCQKDEKEKKPKESKE